MLKKFVEIIQDFVQRLLHGTVLVKTLRKLTEKHGNFEKLIMAMKFNNVEVIMNTLTIRSKELQAFDQTYQVVQEFTHASIHCKGKLNFLLAIGCKNNFIWQWKLGMSQTMCSNILVLICLIFIYIFASFILFVFHVDNKITIETFENLTSVTLSIELM